MTAADSLDTSGIEGVTKPRRRHLVRCLVETNGPLAMADLARDVAAREAETTVGDVEHDAIERVYLSLYHCDVPKLADAGIVEYDRDRRIVELCDRHSEVEVAFPLSEPGALRHRA